jgi:NADH dehydrogenase [ubiquinone] 1 alpha subcomplex assembly factor 5
MQDQELFNRDARAVRRHHIARAAPTDRWLLERMWSEIVWRAQDAKPDASTILMIGHDFGTVPASAFPHAAHITRCDPGAQANWGADVLRCDEDRLPFDPGQFDLILACGTLDSLHDVPGALLLCRRMLKAEGRFFGAMLGGGSLSLLRQIVYGQDDLAVARLHPQIDVRAAGDLLARAGFAQPVGDMETITARYGSWDRYIGDLRANGIGNCFARRHPASRALVETWAERFEATKDVAGKAAEEFCPHYLSGFAAP